MNEEAKKLLLQLLRELVTEQATCEMSGINWATDKFNQINELEKLLSYPNN